MFSLAPPMFLPLRFLSSFCYNRKRNPQKNTIPMSEEVSEDMRIASKEEKIARYRARKSIVSSALDALFRMVLCG